MIHFFCRFSQLCSTKDNSGGESIYERSIIFRHIQVLIGMLNDFQKGPLAIILIFASMLGEALALTLLVKSSNVDVVFYTTVVCILMNCLMILLVILSQLAMIHRKSSYVLEFMRRKHISKRTTRLLKWEHRFYRSCVSLKIMIWSGEFVDTFTPLNCLQSGMVLSANLLLLAGND